jgi:D-arginine dehydrogenase
VAVVGGGIAGAALGYELSVGASVVVLEMEPVLAFHTTGRSAATYMETYGTADARALTTASRGFFENPPAMIESDLMSPLPMVTFGGPGKGDAVIAHYREVRQSVPAVQLLDAAQAVEAFPWLRPEAVEAATLDPNSQALDVHALHSGFVRGLKSLGGVVRTGAKVISIVRESDHWQVGLADGSELQAGIVVDAAGAWADDVAQLVGAAPQGLIPKLRSIFVTSGDPKPGSAMLNELDDDFYLKPDTASWWCSPADATPSEPKNAAADELEIARAIDAINEATTLGVRHVTRTWGGLRTVAPDGNFVFGFDPEVEGFFWYAGQGGYGIQTSPASARFAASVIKGEPVPSDIALLGLDKKRLAPGRFRPL